MSISRNWASQVSLLYFGAVWLASEGVKAFKTAPLGPSAGAGVAAGAPPPPPEAPAGLGEG